MVLVTTALTMDVKSVAGDTLRIKNGTFSETLPLVVRAGVSIVGESLRNTKVQQFQVWYSNQKTLS